jgi:hypothetical protein
MERLGKNNKNPAGSKSEYLRISFLGIKNNPVKPIIPAANNEK